MIRQLPIIPTFIVVGAACVMVYLGIWQLGRADEKATLIARYEAAGANAELVPWPEPADYEASLYRRATVICAEVQSISAISGRAANGAAGWQHIAQCEIDDGRKAAIALGWSRDPASPNWQGGEVTGVIAGYGEAVKLVLEEPEAGLYALASPDPKELPNNHMAYVGQWFFFALTALFIYFMAVRARIKKSR